MYHYRVRCFKKKKKKKENTHTDKMTKTSVDVYMLFTCFVNFKDDYEGLFKICNTDTYLYCFYIKKENIFLSRIYILLSFINKHIFFCELHI